jgi:hypothetical protein
MKKTVTTILAVLFILFACCCPAGAASSPDEAAIVSSDWELTPLYTRAPDSSLRDHSNDMSMQDGILFYTQTTVLALVAGYLILFKVKGIPHGEKMHCRRR